jgi:hypothetical protein
MVQQVITLNPFDVMNENDQISEVPHPLQRVIAVALLACSISSVAIYWVANREVSQLQVWWAELLAYAIVPVAVTFVVLYRSGWHREITGAARTGSLLLFSCLILGGELLAMGILLFVAMLLMSLCGFGVNAVTGGNH